MRISLNKSNIGIFILAYSRLDHLKQTISSLDKKLSKKDKIYIFCDNFSYDQNYKTIEDVKKVRRFLKNLPAKRYIVTFRDKRMGLRKNWHLAWSFMFKKFQKVICLEDDIIINKNFLPFMEYYLNHYEKNNKIMNISGFSTKINLPNNYAYDCYLTKRSMSWGQGSWRRVWLKFKDMKQNHKKILDNNDLKTKLITNGGQDLLRAVVLDYLKIMETIQLWWIWNIIKNNGYCINPSGSLVENIGFDGTGYHTKKGDFFPKNKLFKKRKRLNEIIFLNEINNNFLKRFKINKIYFILFKYLSLTQIKILFKIKKLF